VLLQELTYGKQYTAVEHAENGVFQILQLTKKKNEFVISKQIKASSLKSVLSELKGEKHLFLIVNDGQVLSKKITTTTSNQNSILRAAFPSIAISDFYFEIYKNHQESFVMVSRKETIDNLIASYEKAGNSVIDFSLGNLVVKNLQTLVSNKEICTSNAIINFGTKEITTIEKETISNESYRINDLEVPNTAVLPLAGIIGYYSKNTSSSISKILKEKYLQKRFFDVGLKTGLGFLLGILLINFLFFSSYREKVGNLTGEVQLSATYKSQLNKLQKDINQKKRLVKSVNATSHAKLSQYIEVIGSTVPNTILLTQMKYQPINGVLKVEKELLFDRYKIVVSGTSKENEKFSNWMAVLEQTTWIENVSILQYGKGKRNTSVAKFEFIISINER
jgi:Tfp pilus assembly protein PilN